MKSKVGKGSPSPFGGKRKGKGATAPFGGKRKGKGAAAPFGGIRCEGCGKKIGGKKVWCRKCRARHN